MAVYRLRVGFRLLYGDNDRRERWLKGEGGTVEGVPVLGGYVHWMGARRGKYSESGRKEGPGG